MENIRGFFGRAFPISNLSAPSELWGEEYVCNPSPHLIIERCALLIAHFQFILNSNNSPFFNKSEIDIRYSVFVQPAADMYSITLSHSLNIKVQVFKPCFRPFRSPPARL